jgi:hypothetical protein
MRLSIICLFILTGLFLFTVFYLITNALVLLFPKSIQCAYYTWADKQFQQVFTGVVNLFANEGFITQAIVLRDMLQKFGFFDDNDVQ